MKNSILGKARWLREVALATSKNNGARVAREWLKYAAMFVMLFTIGIGNAWGVTNGDTFTRISDVGDLADGDEIIFVNQAETYACGTTQNKNNRTPVDITVKSHSYTYNSSDNVQVFVVKKNDSGKFGFHTGSGYIYSASNGKNYLNTNTTAASTAPFGTSAWSLSVSSYVFSVTNVTNTSYYLAFNGTTYFSQYKTGQSKPYIYKKESGGGGGDPTLYSVTLKDDESTLTQTSEGGSITLPSRTGCAGYTFAGWTKTWVTDQTEWTTTAPTIIPAGSYTPTANENLYPVYTKEEGGGEPVETKTQTFQYDTWEYGGSSTDKSSYRLFHDGGYVESASDVDFSKLSKVIVYGGTFGGTSYNTISIKKADGTLWKNATVSGSSQTGTNTITGGESLTGSAKLRVYSTKGTASGTGVRISKVEVYTMEGGTTTSYISVPNCCTQLGTINGSIVP